MDYDKELIDNLSKVYYGGIPANILLLCYDRSLFITIGFDDALLVSGDNNYGKNLLGIFS